MKPLKYFVITLLFGTHITLAHAQQNPAALNAAISITPLLGVGDEFDFSFNVGNNGPEAISGANEFSRMRFDMTLGKSRPKVLSQSGLSAIGTDAISGAVLNYFDITYNEEMNTFTGIQKENVVIGGWEMPQCIVHAMVTAASSTANAAEIGASIDVSPNVLAQANNQSELDDNISFFTYSVTLILPSTGIQLHAHLKDGDGMLQWTTVTHTTSSYFQIERSDNGTTYYDIGKLPVASANGSLTAYSYTDPNYLQKTAYYRIILFDKDGKTVTSNVEVLARSLPNAITVFPNPAKKIVTVTGLKENQEIIINDSKGSLIARHRCTGNTKQINIDNYSFGLYLLRVNDNGKVVAIHKLIKN